MKSGVPQAKTFVILLAGAAVLTFYLVHVLWPLALPTSWMDEAHFLIPAISFEKSASFTADQMFLHQVYLVPVGFYIVNGLVFLLSGIQSIHIARAVAFFCVTMSALILRDIVSAALGAIDRERPAFGHALALSWYVSLPVVFAADIARPDSIALLLSLGTLDCVLRSRMAGALALAVLTVMVHPLLAVPAVVAVLCAGAATPVLEIRRWEWLLIGIAGSVLVTESFRMITNFDEYRTHLAFQILRKVNRPLHILPLLAAAGVLLSAGGIVRVAIGQETDIVKRAKIQCLTVLSFGLACIFVQSFGQEMWYFPFALLGFLLSAAALAGIFLPAQKIIGTVARASVVPALIVAAGLSTWLLGVRPNGAYGFHVEPGFLTSITSDRRILDRQIHDMLRQREARRVLVSPFLFDSFLADTAHKADIEAFTWNPLSERADQRFDHAVLLIRGVPSLSDVLPPVLAGYACTSDTRIISPHGHYEVALLTLVYQSPGRATFARCE